MRHLITVAVVLAMLLFTGVTGSYAETTKSFAKLSMDDVHNREILVEINPSRGIKSVSSFCASKGVSHVSTLPLSYTTYQIVTVPADRDYNEVLNELLNDPDVKTAGPNVIKRVSEFIPNDPLFLGGAANLADAMKDPAVKNNQWGLIQSLAPKAWDYETGDPSVVVAVLDTGINFDHEDMKNRVWTNTDEIAGNDTDDDNNGFVDDVRGWDFQGFNANTSTGGDNDPSDPASGTESHGCSTASIIGAQGNNGIGLAGVAGGKAANDGIRLMILRVGTSSSITVGSEIGAIDYAINNGAKVISMSFGGVTGGDPEEDAINRAWNAGLYVCAAAGNVGAGNGNLVDLPAGFDNCVAVGATTVFSTQTVTASTTILQETAAGYSKIGPEVEICAPGTHIMSANKETDGYTNSVSEQFTGTSAATPIIAGAAALLWSYDSSLTNQEVRDRLNGTARDYGTTGRDSTYGFGRVNIYAALVGDDPTFPGDTNNDGTVDENDVPPIIQNFGKTTGQSGYSEHIDTNKDGVIDELDLFAVGTNFGKTKP